MCSESRDDRDLEATVQLDRSQLEEIRCGTDKGCLTVIRGGAHDLGLHLVLDGPTVLGRAPDSDLPIHDLKTSWRHAKVYPTEEGFFLEDLGSTNGTQLEGVLLDRPLRLRNGDKIFVGETVVRFSLADDMDLRFHSEVAQLLGTDPLTGLESKRKFDDSVDYELEMARRSNQTLSLMMMDLDGVKAINDTHGHLFGAHSIREAGRLIGRLIGEKGHSCRFGGDEFTAFLRQCDKIAALDLAEEIRSCLEMARIEMESIRLKPTISIGVATFPDDGQSVVDLIVAADTALYEAKRSGKNCVRCSG